MKTIFTLLIFSIFFLSPGISQTNATFDCEDATAIRQHLEQNGFVGVPTKIVGPSGQVADAELVLDFAELLIEMEGENVSMAQVLERDVRAGKSEGFSAIGIVTKNENFCEEQVKPIIFNDFDKAKYDTSINVHIWENPNSDEDLVFTRYNYVDLNK